MSVAVAHSVRKSRRFEARVDDQTSELIASAAQATGESVSAFVVEAARDRAERVLARTDITMIPVYQFEIMMEALVGPAHVIPELAEVAAQPRVFSRV